MRHRSPRASYIGPLGGGWFAETLRKLGGGSPQKDDESLRGERGSRKFRIFALRK